MEVPLALLADYANVTSDGKLNILGIFDTVWAGKYPATHPQMNVVLRFEAHTAEASQSKDVRIQLMTADGAILLTMNAKLELPALSKNMPPGDPIRMDNIISLNGVRIPNEGDYQIAVLINGDTKRTIPLRARTRPVNIS